MGNEPVCPDCTNYIPVEGDFSFGAQQKSQYPDCSSCVYFSSRNCGKDTGIDHFIFDQPLI